MCGIFGMITKDIDVRDHIINGLTLLQNRGYDSCGIGLINDNQFVIKKYATTNILNALSLLSTNIYNIPNIKYTIGIGHNRWATHGIKTDINAHPHTSEDGQFILVHNGIIENYSKLKNQLQDLNIKFVSQTDTEVIVALLAYNYKIYKDTKMSIKLTIKELTGTYGLVILNRFEPNIIYCVRNGSPLLVGINEDICIITSEQSGFNNKISTYITLDNDDICSIIKTNAGLEMKTDNMYKNRDITSSLRNLSPSPYKHWTIKEIYEQPQTILNSINMGGRIKNDCEVKLGGLESHINLLKDIDNLIILGCGSSYNSGLYGAYFMKLLCNFSNVQVIDGAELSYYDIPKKGKTGFILISQSGETKDLHRCVKIAKEYNIVTIGVINVVDSLIARDVDCGIYCNTGLEIGVASTKSFTSQVICLSLIAIWFSQINNKNVNLRRNIITSLQNLTNDYTKTLDSIKDQVIDIAKKMKHVNNMFILGKGCDTFIAHEGSLKIKEISYIHSESYSASSLKHGPFALLDKDFPVILLNCEDEYLSKITNCYEEIVSREAPILLISTQHLNTIIHSNTNEIIVCKNKYYGSLLGLIPLQLLSYYLSIERGINPDTPKNLAKVVTVE